MLSPLTPHRSSLLLLIFESDANQRVRRAGELGTVLGEGLLDFVQTAQGLCSETLSSSYGVLPVSLLQEQMPGLRLGLKVPGCPAVQPQESVSCRFDSRQLSPYECQELL